MAQAKFLVIDRDRRGEIIYEGYFCAKHWETERPHDLSELEVRTLPETTWCRCTYEDLAPDFQTHGYVNCGEVA